LVSIPSRIRATDYNNTTLGFAYDAANRIARRTLGYQKNSFKRPQT
jgi:hypothetical protein